MSESKDQSADGLHLTSSDAVRDSVYREDVDVSGVDRKSLMRRIDLHVIPWLALLYLLNFLDRCV
jgi:hypothetical protein